MKKLFLTLITLNFASLFCAENSDTEIIIKEGDTPLHIACRKGDLNGVRRCIAYGLSSYAQKPEYESPLAIACKANNLDIVIELINTRHDLNDIIVKHGMYYIITPLIYLNNGNLAIVLAYMYLTELDTNELIFDRDEYADTDIIREEILFKYGSLGFCRSRLEFKEIIIKIFAKKGIGNLDYYYLSRDLKELFTKLINNCDWITLKNIMYAKEKMPSYKLNTTNSQTSNIDEILDVAREDYYKSHLLKITFTESQIGSFAFNLMNKDTNNMTLEEKIMHLKNLEELITIIARQFNLLHIFDKYGNNLLHVAADKKLDNIIILLLSFQTGLLTQKNDKNISPISILVMHPKILENITKYIFTKNR